MEATGVLFLVEETLTKYQWSPEQIAGYLGKKGIYISHETIYKHIWQDKHSGGSLFKNLRNQGKKYNKRKGKVVGGGVIPNRVDIKDRPQIVEQKSRVGDFDLDTIVGAMHKGAIVSIVDRKTKLVRLSLIQAATAKETASQIILTFNEPLKCNSHKSPCFLVQIG